MKVLAWIFIAGLLLTVGALGMQRYLQNNNNPPIRQPADEPTPQASPQPNEQARITVIAEGLDTPWAIAFLPDNAMLVTERAGRVRLVDSSGRLQSDPVATLSNVREAGEGGLLGIALDPDFSSNNYVYFYYTYNASGDETLNRVVRMRYQDNKLTDEKVLVDKIPGAANHNGGRIKFGPDGYLYIGTGDAGNPSQAQDKNSLAGKILRYKTQVEVYSLGHRNVQGLTWDNNKFYASEHGRSGIQSGFDELNLVEQGRNYGWPDIEGDKTKVGMEKPLLHSGASTTWAPSGAAYLDGSVYFAGLRGQALYQLKLDGLELKEHFKGEFGRLREVVTHQGFLYVTTSNKDGRGNPTTGDDKILKINPQNL